MRIKTIVSGVAVALAVSVGSAFAAEEFATLDGVTAEPMNAVELDQIKGSHVVLADPAGSMPFSGPQSPIPDTVGGFVAGVTTIGLAGTNVHVGHII